MVRIILVCLAFFSFTLPSQAQFLPQSSGEKPIFLPEDLTPELVDGVLARLTDSEIRELLRAELMRQAEDKMVEEPGPGAFELIDTRLSDMAAEIDTRMTRWAKALANIDSRYDIVNKRMQEGDYGLTGTILAAIAVIVAGFSAAFRDCSKSGGFALAASEKRLDRGLYGVVSLSAW